ncbi:MAG: PfkB family carbohydrate kinase [Spirochaetales bacterium]|nr:PfkB family carbohydrate kinase [Spirochaetales bacterium]
MATSTEPVFLCVCLNPVLQKTLVYERIRRGEVNRTSHWRIDAAGKGICASRVLTQLGERALHLTHLGGPTREWFLALCKEDNLEVAWVESHSPIRFCTTLVEESMGQATELVEESLPVDEGTFARLLDRYREILPQVTTVLLSGTVAQGYPPEAMATLARLAAQAGKHLYLDLKRHDLRACLAYNPVCVKPNLEELAQTMGIPYDSLSEESRARELVAEAGRHFYRSYGSWLVVTRGTRSTLYWDGTALREQEVFLHARALNPIGSGDAFGAGLARMLERGKSLQEAVLEGTRLGALNAAMLKPGSLFV